jgi:uncharacterized protein YdeI (YjbR/CyaY-like superfamily)
VYIASALRGDFMPDQLFDPRVDAYIERAAPFAQPILTHLRELMHQACPHATETIKWNIPFFVQQGIILAGMAAFKRHCSFGFWGPEMKKVLEKDGLKSSPILGSLGHVTDLDSLPSDRVLLTYMSQAADFVESGQRTKSIDRPKKTARSPVRVPPELAAALKRNKMATKVFAEFSPSRKRDYAIWIAEAKRAETKQKRVKQAVEWIAQGKQRDWKYMNY